MSQTRYYDVNSVQAQTVAPAETFNDVPLGAFNVIAISNVTLPYGVSLWNTNVYYSKKQDTCDKMCNGLTNRTNIEWNE